MEEFARILGRLAPKGGSLPPHTRITFTWRREGILDVTIADDTIGLLLSPELCWALFDLLLGAEGVF